MGVRDWIGNKLFNIDKVVANKVQERLAKYSSVETNEYMTYRQKENLVWAKGNADRLLDFYKSTAKPSNYGADRYQFWRWIGGDIKVPKLHYPAAESLLNSMKSLIFGSEPAVEFISVEDKGKSEVVKLNERLENIMSDNNINEFYQNGVFMESYSGTIGCKFTIDKEVSKYPIMQLYPEERLELKTRYGRVVEIIFVDYYKIKDKTYTLKSYYGFGYIKYKLFNEKAEEVPLATISELSELEDTTFNQKILMATYKKNRTTNIEFPDSAYGGSDFEGVIDLFHQIDEIYSSMALYIRRSRPIQSIVESMLPISEKGDRTIIPKEYELDTIVLRKDQDANNVSNNVFRDIPEIKLDQYINSIKQLQASIYQKVGYSNTSSGLELVGANQSGQALMEREKSTVILYLNKVKLWEHFLKETFRLALVYEDLLNDKKIKTDYKEFDLSVEFPDYHTETFESRVKVYTEAYRGMAVDIETMVNELFKDSKEQEQINKIIMNIKLENGISLLPDQVITDEVILPEGE